MTNPPDNALEFAAERAAADPFFLGSLLAVVCSTRHIGPPELARQLQCPVEALPKLYLCRAPRATVPEFREDVAQAAVFTGCDSASLGAIVREAMSVAALQPGSAGKVAPRLLAARDREEEIREEEDGHV